MVDCGGQAGSEEGYGDEDDDVDMFWEDDRIVAEDFSTREIGGIVNDVSASRENAIWNQPSSIDHQIPTQEIRGPLLTTPHNIMQPQPSQFNHDPPPYTPPLHSNSTHANTIVPIRPPYHHVLYTPYHEHHFEIVLPQTWTMNLCPITGHQYYLDHISKTTRWTRPPTSASSLSISSPNIQRYTIPLPPDWDLHVSEIGDLFYFDRFTEVEYERWPFVECLWKIW